MNSTDYTLLKQFLLIKTLKWNQTELNGKHGKTEFVKDDNDNFKELDMLFDY